MDQDEVKMKKKKRPTTEKCKVEKTKHWRRKTQAKDKIIKENTKMIERQFAKLPENRERNQERNVEHGERQGKQEPRRWKGT